MCLSLSIFGNFSSWTSFSRYRKVSILDFIGAKDDGGGDVSWSYKMCKVPVKLSPPTNHYPAFCKPDARPAAQPTVSEN